MKKLISLLLALTMMLSASAAFAAAATATEQPAATEQASAAPTERPYYKLDELGIKLFVDSNWEQYARNYYVNAEVKTAYDDAGNLSSGMLILLPHSYDTSDDTNVTFNAKGGLLGVSVLMDGADAQSAVMGQDFAGYEATELGKADGYTFTFYKNPAPDAASLQDDEKGLQEAVAAAFADPKANFELSKPATKQELATLIQDFSAKDINGNAVDKSVLKNAPYTIIDVWATYCSPCIDEMPELAELAKEYEGKVQFLGIVSDASDADTIDTARSIVEKTGVGYTCIVPDESLTKTLLSKIQYTPTKIIVDQNGQMVGDMIIGGQDKAALKAVLDALPQK